MVTVRRVFFATGLLLFQYPAFSIEPSDSVKATTLLKAENSWDGKQITYPEGQAEVTGMLIEIAPGGETGWHLHQVPSFGAVLEGELEVRLKDGQTKKAKAGDAFAEVVGTLHNGHNAGTVPVKIIVFYVGASGKMLTVKEAAH